MRLILHIGAHRCGSTLIERMLSGAAVPGLRVWAPRDVREIKTFAGVAQMFDQDGTRKDADAVTALRVDLAARIAALEADGVQTLLISEENLLGSMVQNFNRGCLYPMAGSRLAAYAAVMPVAPVRIALAIREYGAVWNSAYGYAGRRNKNLRSATAVAADAVAKTRGWTEVLSAVVEVWPEAEILLWRQEDLDANAPKIAGKVADLSMLPAQPVRAINSNVEKGQVVELFTPEERRALTARYVRDVARLLEMPGLTWAHRPEAA